MKRKQKLKPIGEGSYAESHGYDFELLMSWLESIRDEEIEKAEEKPAYEKRADAFSDAVDRLNEISEM